MKMRKVRSVISLILAISIIISLAITALALDNEENAIAETARASRSGTYTARIMQGNTNEEDDCRAIENGLINSGGYTTTSIVETGWTYTNSTTSSINEVRANATNFLYSKLYDFAYFSGHGTATNGPRLNVTGSASLTSGTYETFNVANTLNVTNNSTWRTDSLWQSGDNLKVLVIAACKQLDSTVMHYYARAMRASSVMAIAGYHETSPGHSADMGVATRFLNTANSNNSVKFSWSDANTTAEKTYPWAVLVYTESNNEYYRIPGFPVYSYPAPSSGAAVYRFRSGQSGSAIVSYSKSRGTSESMPLYLSVIDTRTGADTAKNREAVGATNDLPLNTQLSDTYIKKLLETDDLSEFTVVQTPVFRDEIDIGNGGAVTNTETIVERVYHYYNTYNGIKIADAAIIVSVDEDGIYNVKDYWKVPVESAESSRSNWVSSNSIITEKQAWINVASSMTERIELLRSELVYAPITGDAGEYKLAYEILCTDSRMFYVDAENGSVYEV